jgi:hypothetical protein
MKEPKLDSLDFLLQTDVIEEILPAIGKKQWQTLHLNADDDPHRFGMWSALLEKKAVKKAMRNDGWDLRRGDGKPGFMQSWSKGKKITSYLRFGDDDGFRPFVSYRYFWDAFPSYVELDEEFRLYHDLAEDKEQGLLLAFDESGREIQVARITPDGVSVQLKYLRQFQAGTDLYLAIYIDSVRYSNIAINDVPAYKKHLSDANNLIRWERAVAKCEFPVTQFKTFSRVLGKIILPPPSRKNAGIWPYKDDANKKTASFIIGVDSMGNQIEHSADPKTLSDYFGGNSGEPNYLTPVYFRREVLSKYYAEPERYTVADGRLCCLSLWSCQIDNDLESHVVVFLGDLGRDLPYDEQLHWRQFNVAPEGGVSETNFRRSFLNQFTDPKSPDLTFRHLYITINRNWERAFGWSLFLPPSLEDKHLLGTVRIPVTNSQNEFDEQIGHITKLVIDSLNEKELIKATGAVIEGTKGIGKLDNFLAITKFPQREAVIQLLRDLQSLRSTGSAHRKGSEYQRIVAKLNVDPKRKPDTIRMFLQEIIVALSALQSFYCRD